MSEKTPKERPIIFGPESVTAILAGRKTQSRRVVKDERILIRTGEVGTGLRLYSSDEAARFCPYGKPGERLWVREAFSLHRGDDADWPERARAHCRRDPDDPATVAVFHRPDEGDPARDPLFFLGHRWHSPIHMPRRHSRLTLELTGVRVERLHDVTPGDIAAEGIHDEAFNEKYPNQALGDFAMSWDDLNARRGYPWSSNPWVWVLDFKKVEG